MSDQPTAGSISRLPPTDLLVRIAAAAAAVRSAQRAYFRDRSPENLRASKALEGQLDALLAEHEAQASGIVQASIFT